LVEEYQPSSGKGHTGRSAVMVLDVPKDIDEAGESLGDTQWLGTTEAARYLGVVPRTLYRMIDEGQVPAYKMGRVIRVRRADVDVFLESTRVQPGSLRHLYPGAEEPE
jgi:excisionase family DNA binding protein